MKVKTKNYGLTERDIEVVFGIAKYRYLKTSQIQLLNFPSRRVANRRLTILTDCGYLKRFHVPELLGKRIREYAYCLDNKGVRLKMIEENDSFEGGKRKVKKMPEKSIFLTHLLDLNDFRIALEIACHNVTVHLVGFVADYDTFTIDGKVERATQESTTDFYEPEKTINFIPDGTFVLENLSGNQALFFVEIDEGTAKIESLRYPDFTDKLIAYASYYKNMGFKRHGEHFKGFRVLVVTKSNGRIESYREVSSKIGIKKLVWFTTFEKVSKDTIFKPIWKIADFSDNNFYKIL